MKELPRVLTETALKVVTALLATAVVSSLALFSKGVQRAIFYKRHDFALPYPSATSPGEWDIQWENLRVTLEVATVHNEYLEGVTIKTNDVNPGQTLPKMNVSEKYTLIPGPPRWYLKLGRIVRTGPKNMRDFTIYITVLRRRW